MSIAVQQLLESGVHFGHRCSRWNPRMEPFIYGKRNTIHIIDLKQTIRGLLRAQNFLRRLCGDGERVLWVGTKRQAQNVMLSNAKRTGMPYVVDRWLGGTLTNFEVIRTRLKRLDELEKLETDGELNRMKKKEISAHNREMKKLRRNLGGIREMSKRPGALVIVDPRREKNALFEAHKLGIPSICIIDTDSDPLLVDIPIPANDDAVRSIQILTDALADAVVEGSVIAKERGGAQAKTDDRRRTVVVRPRAVVGAEGAGGAGAAADGAAPEVDSSSSAGSNAGSAADAASRSNSGSAADAASRSNSGSAADAASRVAPQ